MLLATIICSDPDCHEEIELRIESLDELEGVVCDCGFGFVLARVAEARGPGGELVELGATRRPALERRAA